MGAGFPSDTSSITSSGREEAKPLRIEEVCHFVVCKSITLEGPLERICMENILELWHLEECAYVDVTDKLHLLLWGHVKDKQI